MRLAILAAAALLGSTSALGHSWFPSECCSGSDCGWVECGEVSRRADGDYVWRGFVFHQSLLRKSPDGNCYTCLRPQVGTMKRPLCLFAPPFV